MTTELANLDRYKIIELGRAKVPGFLLVDLGKHTLSCTVAWFIFAACISMIFFWVQAIIGLIIFLTSATWKNSGYRTHIELKAKGIKVRNYMAAGEERLIPWDWLKSVELRHRGWNLFPNYVCFNFKNRSDCLILLDEVLEDMDVTTLIECVRTWAPNAGLRGDVWLTKSESIATYTELWLKDLSKLDKRRRLEQTHEQDTILNGEYRVVRTLSSGGQGTAYLASTENAELSGLPSHVVLKEFILPENDRGFRKVKEGLLREAALLRRIDHPLIIRFYDCFIEDLRGYLVVEYSEGTTLKDLVMQSGPPSESLVRSVSMQLCDALAYLHSLTPPIIHGDVSPDNVILHPDGKIKLLDFAAAQELSRSRTATVIGKHSYMAPEQFRGMPGPSSDVYSLGCTIYFLLTGLEPEPITELHPKHVLQSVSEAMDRIVFSATQLNQSARISDATVMKAQLEQVKPNGF